MTLNETVAFGWRLRELRAAHGVSQDDLARRTGIHHTAIGRFERGAREPKLTSILRLARGLCVKPVRYWTTLIAGGSPQTVRADRGWERHVAGLGVALSRSRYAAWVSP